MDPEFTTLSPRELVGRILPAGLCPQDDLLARILKVGAPCVGPLVEIMTDEALDVDISLLPAAVPPESWAPMTAATLLCDMRASDAIRSMIDVLRVKGPGAFVSNAIVLGMPKMGARVVNAVVTAHSASSDPFFRMALSEILARTDVQDNRIWNILVAQLDEDLTFAASNLARYGDPRALPLLIAQLEHLEPGTPVSDECHPILDVCAAIESLGGVLSAEQAAKLDEVGAQRRSAWGQGPQREVRPLMEQIKAMAAGS